jgi:hypothetical protein
MLSRVKNTVNLGDAALKVPSANIICQPTYPILWSGGFVLVGPIGGGPGMRGLRPVLYRNVLSTLVSPIRNGYCAIDGKAFKSNYPFLPKVSIFSSWSDCVYLTRIPSLYCLKCPKIDI